MFPGRDFRLDLPFAGQIQFSCRTGPCEEVRREIEGDRIFVERISSTAELPLSEESKKILAYASHEAESMMHPYVGTEHLLIGLLRVGGRVVMDDVTPGQPAEGDMKREFFHDPRLVSVEVVFPDLRNSLLAGTRVS